MSAYRLRRWWWAAGLLAAAVLSWFALPAGLPAPGMPDDAGGALQAPVFVKSMQDTVPDGTALTPSAAAHDADDSALAYGELRRLFDYYLSALGEKDLPAIIRQIQTELDRRLSATQSRKAQHLLELYLQFKRALVDLQARPALAGSGVTAIRQRMQAQQNLRTQYFTPAEVEGLFGFEDRMDSDAVARLEISENPRLNARQKQAQLAALDAAMPAPLRAERETSQIVMRVEQRAAALRERGASDDEIYRMRAQALDAGAASRLADLDREEAAWKQRIEAYLEARSTLLKTQPNATAAERQHALTALQQNRFSDDERRRLPAYEPQ